jgi:hypothetical protein
MIISRPSTVTEPPCWAAMGRKYGCMPTAAASSARVNAYAFAKMSRSIASIGSSPSSSPGGELTRWESADLGTGASGFGDNAPGTIARRLASRMAVPTASRSSADDA